MKSLIHPALGDKIGIFVSNLEYDPSTACVARAWPNLLAAAVRIEGVEIGLVRLIGCPVQREAQMKFRFSAAAMIVAGLAATALGSLAICVHGASGAESSATAASKPQVLGITRAIDGEGHTCFTRLPLLSFLVEASGVPSTTEGASATDLSGDSYMEYTGRRTLLASQAQRAFFRAKGPFETHEAWATRWRAACDSLSDVLRVLSGTEQSFQGLDIYLKEYDAESQVATVMILGDAEPRLPLQVVDCQWCSSAYDAANAYMVGVASAGRELYARVAIAPNVLAAAMSGQPASSGPVRGLKASVRILWSLYSEAAPESYSHDANEIIKSDPKDGVPTDDGTGRVLFGYSLLLSERLCGRVTEFSLVDGEGRIIAQAAGRCSK